MLKFTAKFYDATTGKLLDEAKVNGQPIRSGERIPNVGPVALAVVTKVEPDSPRRSRSAGLLQKVWVRDYYRTEEWESRSPGK